MFRTCRKSLRVFSQAGSRARARPPWGSRVRDFEIRPALPRAIRDCGWKFFRQTPGALPPILRALGEDLAELTRALEVLNEPDPQPGSRARIARAIASGNDGVARIPGKHGGGAENFCKLTVLVPDEPGELARLLGDMGEEQINLEDLRLEHSLGQRVGLAHVSVMRADEQRLTAMLEKRGWARAGTE